MYSCTGCQVTVLANWLWNWITDCRSCWLASLLADLLRYWLTSFCADCLAAVMNNWLLSWLRECCPWWLPAALLNDYLLCFLISWSTGWLTSFVVYVTSSSPLKCTELAKLQIPIAITAITVKLQQDNSCYTVPHYRHTGTYITYTHWNTSWPRWKTVAFPGDATII